MMKQAFVVMCCFHSLAPFCQPSLFSVRVYSVTCGLQAIQVTGSEEKKNETHFDTNLIFHNTFTSGNKIVRSAARYMDTLIN